MDRAGLLLHGQCGTCGPLEVRLGDRRVYGYRERADSANYIFDGRQ